MIELNRFIRVRPEGLAHLEVTAEDGGGVVVYFSRFDVETGKPIEPERSFLAFSEIEAKLAEMERQILALRELAALKPR